MSERKAALRYPSESEDGSRCQKPVLCSHRWMFSPRGGATLSRVGLASWVPSVLSCCATLLGLSHRQLALAVLPRSSRAMSRPANSVPRQRGNGNDVVGSGRRCALRASCGFALNARSNPSNGSWMQTAP